MPSSSIPSHSTAKAFVNYTFFNMLDNIQLLSEVLSCGKVKQVIIFRRVGALLAQYGVENKGGRLLAQLRTFLLVILEISYMHWVW